MSHRINYVNFLEMIENRSARRIVERINPMELSDFEFHRRFRLTQDSVMELLRLIDDEINPPSHLNNSLSSLEQLLIALRYFASGSHQLVVGDTLGVSQSAVSRSIHKVSRAIAALRPRFISMPETEEDCEEVCIISVFNMLLFYYYFLHVK